MPRRHRQPSPLLSLPVLIILFPIIILIFLCCIIPPFLSLTSQILRPTITVKKSWDSLNVFLVIFAILCGIFAKRNDDGSATDEDDHPSPENISNPINIATNNTSTSDQSAESVLPQQWFGYSERTPETRGGRGLRRSSSSYPDLRQLGQDSLWESRDHNKNQFRFFDDFQINGYNRTPPKSYQSRSGESSSDVIKEIPVDTFELHSSSPPPKSAVPPPPPPPPPRQRTRRTYRTVGRKEQKKEKVVNHVSKEAVEFERVRSPPPTPPPPPPPRPAAPPSPMRTRSEPKRRKNNVKKEIAMVWASVLSKQRKRKKQKADATATRNIYDTATHDSPPQQQPDGEGQYYYTRPPPSPPPPPPPPPPPYSVFHNLFKKGMNKTKKVHSVSTPPSPPPPPPRPTLRKLKSWSTNFPSKPPTPPQQQSPVASRRRASTASGRPPLPTNSNSYSYEENANSGCQSPLIPPPPPPPPFKMQELKFFGRGDFVKIRSNQSSRCGSPELEDVEELSVKDEDEMRESKSESSETQGKVNLMDGGDGGGGGGGVGGGSSVFCPSPDVNMKADSFIARLRDEWRLEKMNSAREKKKMA